MVNHGILSLLDKDKTKKQLAEIKNKCCPVETIHEYELISF